MIAEGPLLEALEGVHSGRLRVQEAYRQIRAAETTAFDRNAAREVLRKWDNNGYDGFEVAALDALEACVRPAPPQTIDRDALYGLLVDLGYSKTVSSDVGLVESILALLRPVEGVVLSREEAVRVRRWYQSALDGVDMTEHGDADLVERLGQA